MKRSDAIDFELELWRSLDTRQQKMVFDIIAKNSWWVSSQVYAKIQVVYPKTRRKTPKEERGTLIDGLMVWQNQPARRAFWLALGKTPRYFKNAEVCHIYSEGVKNPNHYTNLANLTALPISLASLTEVGPVNALLRYHSYRRYGYKGLTGTVPKYNGYYPSDWPHTGEMAPARTDTVVVKLKHQLETRPWYRRQDPKDGAAEAQ